MKHKNGGMLAQAPNTHYLCNVLQGKRGRKEAAGSNSGSLPKAPPDTPSEAGKDPPDDVKGIRSPHTEHTENKV